MPPKRLGLCSVLDGYLGLRQLSSVMAKRRRVASAPGTRPAPSTIQVSSGACGERSRIALRAPAPAPRPTRAPPARHSASAAGTCLRK